MEMIDVPDLHLMIKNGSDAQVCGCADGLMGCVPGRLCCTYTGGDVHCWWKECGVIRGCVDGSEAVPLRFVAVLICRGCLGNDVLSY